MGQATGGVLCCGALVSASQAPASEELELDALVEVESAPRGIGHDGWHCGTACARRGTVRSDVGVLAELEAAVGLPVVR